MLANRTVRAILLAATVVVGCGAAIGAQAHADGWFFPGVGHVYALRPGGAIASVQTSNRATYAAAMDRDNRFLLMLDIPTRSIVKVDPATLAVVGTLCTDPSLSSVNAVQDIAVGCDGDVYYTGTYPRPGVFRVGGGVITTVLAGPPFAAGAGNLSIDVDTGDLLVTDPPFTKNGLLYRVSRTGASVATVGLGLDPRYGSYQDVLTGDVYSGTCCGDGLPSSNGKSLLVVPKSSGLAVTYLNHGTLIGAYSPCPDRASMASPRLVVGAFGTPSVPGSGGVWSIDLTTGAPSKLTTVSIGSLFRAVPIHGRDIHSIRVGATHWAVGITIPSQAKQPWVAGFGVSGVRPGVALPDGRTIPLVVDAVTRAALAGTLSSIVSATTGTLDAEGGTRLFVDLSRTSLPPGVVLHVVVAVLDPAAPLGIALITDPHPIALARG